MEEPSLSEAAARLNMSQQALSAALRQLERELKVSLFVRAGRRLSPTAAAHNLYAGAPTLLAGARQLAERTNAANTDALRPFIIGRSPAVTAEEAFAVLTSLLTHRDAPPITVRETFPPAMARELQDGTIDLALRRGIGSATPALEEATLTYQRLRVAMHRDHPLANSEAVTFACLAASPIVVWAPPKASAYTDFLVAQCRRAGFEPDLVVNRVQGTPPTTAVLVYPQAVAFVTEQAGTKHADAVIVRELADAPSVPLQAIWLPHTVNPHRTALLQASQTHRPAVDPSSTFSPGRHR